MWSEKYLLLYFIPNLLTEPLHSAYNSHNPQHIYVHAKARFKNRVKSCHVLPISRAATTSFVCMCVHARLFFVARRGSFPLRREKKIISSPSSETKINEKKFSNISPATRAALLCRTSRAALTPFFSRVQVCIYTFRRFFFSTVGDSCRRITRLKVKASNQ